jgi:O-antigen/teichoic acid export membrane protein
VAAGNPPTNAPAERTVQPSALVTLAERVVSHTSIFAVGASAGLVLSAVRIAVLTRLLEISVYGQLTLLVVLAGFVTVLSRILIITGSLRASFRGGDDDDDDDAGADEGEQAKLTSGYDPRRVLGTSLIGSMLLTAVLVAGVAAFAKPIDEMLIDSGLQFAVIAAILLGGLDGSFQLVSQIARYERRPVTHVALLLTHALLGLVAATTLIEAGYGLEGAIGGLALGSALALVLGMWVSRHRFSLTVDFGYLAMLARLGAPFIGLALGAWLFRQTDILMISRYLSTDDVALYRVAARIGALIAGLVGGVLFAWGPLMRGPLRGSLHREGLLVTAKAGLLTYFWLVAIWLIVALFLTRDLLIRIAPPEYGQVAYLIAFLGVASLLTSGLIVVHRTSGLKRRRLILTAFYLGMSPVLVALCVLLIPRFGLDGAAAATIVTPLSTAAMYLVISQRIGSESLDLPWARLALATSLGAGYSVLFVLIARAIGDAGIYVSVAAALIFPGALVLTGALPREDATTIVKLLIRLPRRRGPRFADGLTSLDDRDIEVLDALLRRRRAPVEVARATDRDEDELLERFVYLLREVGKIGHPRPTDNLVGRYLLSPTNVTLRDREGHLLALDRGVDSMDVDQLTTLTDRISKLSEKQWLALTSRDETGGEAG